MPGKADFLCVLMAIKKIKLSEMKKIRQATTLWVLTLLLALAACQKDRTPAPAVEVPVSLQEYVNTHLPAAQREQLAWGSAKAITQRGKVAGYSIPMANGQSRLIAVATPEGWLCNRMGSSPTEVWLEDLGQTTRVVSRMAAGKVVTTTKYHHGQAQEETGLSIAISGNPQTISHNGIPYFLLTSSTATGSPASPVYYITADDGNGGNAGGGFNAPALITVNFDYLAEELDLNPTEYYWLFSHAMEASQTYVYLTTSSQAEKKVIAKEHINEMIYNAKYRSFAEGHTQTGDAGKVWWEDSSWISNPNNFTLDHTPPAPPENFSELTVEEKLLTAAFPIQAFVMKENISEAKAMSTTKMGQGTNNGLNDKKDAFRHAFFQAINVRDVPSRIVPYVSAADIVLMFSNAHESEVSPFLALEKEMDLHNNAEGIAYGNGVSYFTSNESVANGIMQKLNNGDLRYLSPLDMNGHPRFDKNNPYDPLNTNGIIRSGPNQTKLIKTNQ
jgi:hypothetical protein